MRELQARFRAVHHWGCDGDVLAAVDDAAVDPL